jgi:hypothetical protein
MPSSITDARTPASGSSSGPPAPTLVLERQVRRPRWRSVDRLTLAGLSRGLPRPTWFCFLVSPQTRSRWHRDLVRRRWALFARRPGSDAPVSPPSAARQLEEAGAWGLELNVYFIPTDLTMTSEAVEQRYLDIVRAVRQAVTIPVAVKLSPYFSAFGNIAPKLDNAGAGALVLFNRFYQPDIDLVQLRLLNDLKLSGRHEIRLPLLWIAVLSGRVGASLAATTGVETSDEVLKYILAGADVVMTTSALLRHGVEYVASLLAGVTSWLAGRDISSLDDVRGMLSRQRLGATDDSERANYLEILRGYRVG